MLKTWLQILGCCKILKNIVFIRLQKKYAFYVNNIESYICVINPNAMNYGRWDTRTCRGGKCGNDDYIYKWEVLWSLIINVHEVPHPLALNLFKTCTRLVSLFFVVETYFLIIIIWRRYLKFNLSFSLNVRFGLGAPSLPLHLPLG